MYKTYTIKQFRENTRAILNRALIEPVRIKRYDEEFVLSSAGEVSSFKKPILKQEQRSALENRIETYSEGFCPAGHSIPTGHSKCMGKGCKYAH